MKPIKFPQSNRVISRLKPAPLSLPDMPYHVDQDGVVTICWQMSWAERLRLLFIGKLWHTQLTYHTPIQPCRPTAYCPFITVTRKQQEILDDMLKKTKMDGRSAI